MPILVRILEESQPLGNDRELVLDTVSALGSVGTDAAVPALVRLSQKRSFFGRKKVRALKEACVDALARVGTAKSAAALKEAATTGDGMLRKIAAQKAKA